MVHFSFGVAKVYGREVGVARSGYKYKAQQAGKRKDRTSEKVTR